MASADVNEQRRELRGTGEEITAAITFRVSSSTDAITLSNENIVLAQPDLPTLGQAHPDIPNLRANDRRVVRSTDSAGSNPVWDVTFEYVPLEIISGGPTGAIENNVNLSFRTQWIDAWRTSDATGQYGSMTATTQINRTNTGPDIGGLAIDSNGEAVSVAVYLANLDIVQVTNNTTIVSISNSLVGKRNEADYLGFPAGQLLYLGGDITGTLAESRITITHHFQNDNFSHLRQIPWRDPTTKQIQWGQVVGNSTFGSFAYPVFWVQPYPQVASFLPLGITPENNPGPGV